MSPEPLTKIESARLASGLTVEDARKIVGLSFTPYRDREKNPSLFTVGELSKLSRELNRDGKTILREWLVSFFVLVSDV